MSARRLPVAAAAVLVALAGVGGGAGWSAPSGLVLALGFEDGAGQLARDASGLGNDAALSGARLTADGRFGGAVECDGVDDRLTVAGVDALDLTGALTVSAWVRLRSLGGDQMTLALKEGSDHLAYALWARSASGRAPLGRVSGGHYARALEPLAVGEWTYVAFTFDGERLRLYVDGVLAGERFRQTPLVHSAGPLRICGNSFWGHYLDGSVDELRVYDRALSPDELAGDAATPIETVSPELCGDGLDNDRDGIVDDACIGGRAWFDSRNRNGIQEAGEPGLAGVQFRLRTGGGTLVASTLSDANGNYHFSDVPAGTYFVETTNPGPARSLVAPDRGTDDTLDSDFPGPGLRTAAFAFPENGSISHLDAGFANFLD